MPQIELTITISVILALAAIISPIFTTIINNRYQLKVKKLELKQKEYEQTILYKRNIFENYLRYLNDVLQNPTDKSLSGYAQYYPLAFMYLPPDVQQKLSIVNHKIGQSLGQSARASIVDEIDEIIICISTELQKL